LPIIIGAPVVLGVAYVSYKEKRFSAVIEIIFAFGIQYGLIFGVFYILSNNGIFVLTQDVMLTYLLSAILGLMAVVSKAKLLEFIIICVFSTAVAIMFLPTDLIVLISTGIASALLAALIVKGFVFLSNKKRNIKK
jgi:hypothetical protein